MSNVLIRDVLPDDLDQIRSAAAEQGASLQSYLRDAVHAQAVYLRRQAAIAATAERLRGGSPVPEGERDVVLSLVDQAHQERADQLSSRPAG